MGYDDDVDRSRRRQSRARQPVKRPGTREPEYRKIKEQKYEAPRSMSSGHEVYGAKAYAPKAPKKVERELNLITDTFRYDDKLNNRGFNDTRGSRAPDRRGKESRSRDSARRQTAAAKQGGGAYHTPAKKKAQKKRRKLLIILIELVILISVVVFAAYSYLDRSMSKMVKLPWNPSEIKNVEISQEKQEQMKGYWTIAVFGVDSRNSSVGKGNNSDVNMICNINQDTGEIKLVSVYRDTYLNINDKNHYNKINSAYLNGGPDQAVKALNKNLDLDIDDYATFNWKAVADAINILDGIDVELSKPEFYYINAFVTETVKATGVPSEPVKHAGLVHLDGVQAVAYGRLRLMDTDYARTERQRKVIMLAFEKAKKADWATLNNVIQTVFPQVSSSVELTDILMRGRDIGKYHLGETIGFPAARGEVDMGSKGACVIPQTLESNVTELHKFLFGDEDYIPTESVKTISKKIISDSGLAKAAKPAGSADTNGGSIPKSTADAENDKKKESSGTDYDESGTGRESGAGKESENDRESGTDESTRDGRPEGGTGGWEKWETDENGVYIDPTARESEGSIVRPGTGTTKPGTDTTKPGTGTTKPGTDTTTPGTGGETAPGRPGTGGTNGGQNAPGMNTDTGVILGPGAGNNPGSGNNNNPNAPGSGSSNNPSAPGGSNNNNPNAPGGSNNNNPNAPGSGSSNQAPGFGGGNVEFTGPTGP